MRSTYKHPELNRLPCVGLATARELKLVVYVHEGSHKGVQGVFSEEGKRAR